LKIFNKEEKMDIILPGGSPITIAYKKTLIANEGTIFTQAGLTELTTIAYENKLNFNKKEFSLHIKVHKLSDLDWLIQESGQCVDIVIKHNNNTYVINDLYLYTIVKLFNNNISLELFFDNIPKKATGSEINNITNLSLGHTWKTNIINGDDFELIQQHQERDPTALVKRYIRSKTFGKVISIEQIKNQEIEIFNNEQKNLLKVTWNKNTFDLILKKCESFINLFVLLPSNWMDFITEENEIFEKIKITHENTGIKIIAENKLGSYPIAINKEYLANYLTAKIQNQSINLEFLKYKSI
jgi:hypothetical protein